MRPTRQPVSFSFFCKVFITIFCIALTDARFTAMSLSMHPDTRKFTRGLNKPGTAAELRQSVSEVVRTSVWMVKPKVIEPLDYESVVLQRRTQIISDALRDMLQYPTDDFQISTVRHQGRTLVSTVPDRAEKEARSLFLQECIKTYKSDWHVVQYKYEDYSGDFRQLPNKVSRPEKLTVHLFEVDEDVEKDEDAASLGAQKGGLSKRGWLYKGNMNNAISVTMRSFKRRYFHLAQLGDGSYNLNFYKDEKTSKDPKGTIFLDSCIGVGQNSKVRRFAFELKMQDGSSYLLAADSEAEMADWVFTLNKILHSSFDLVAQDKRNGDLHDGVCVCVCTLSRRLGVKLAADTSFCLFGNAAVLPKLDLSGIEPDVRQFEEKFGTRVLVNCHSLTFNLQSCVAENAEGPTTNVEPFYVVLSLFDVQNSRKISADFHVDLNHPLVRGMTAAFRPEERHLNGGGDGDRPPWRADRLPEEALQYPRQGVFSVTCPHPEIFLVARIEKVLQGGITHCTEPYMKSSDSTKVSQKVLKNAKLACSRLGKYRMPFAWAARPVFKDASGMLDKASGFLAIYRQDSGKLSDNDMLKLLTDFRKLMAKLPVILGNLDITIDNVAPDLTNCVTSSYLPVRPFEGTEPSALLEVEEFVPCIAKCSQPFTIYKNHLYVYPRHLKYDGQKAFAKLFVNIHHCKEYFIRCSCVSMVTISSLWFQCIYGRPGGPLFTKQAFAIVLHHQQNPEFYDEIKIELPPQLDEKHHLLFSFYHISCDSNSKKDQVEAQVGWAWLPLLREGRVITNEQQMPITTALPPGYLSIGDGVVKHSGPEIKWVDGGKPLFKLSTHLVSTVHTQDQHLHNFFHHWQNMECVLDGPTTDPSDPLLGSPEQELIKYLKSLHAMQGHVMVNFLPTILNQLFSVLTRTTQEEVAVNVIRVMVHIVAQCHEEGLEHHLRSYVKIRHFDVFCHFVLQYSWYFLEVLVKSMAHYLIVSGKVKLCRNQRFSASFHHTVETLIHMLMPHITQKYKDNLDTARNANHSLAIFIKRCFTFMDRGFVFKQINNYINCFLPGDPKTLYEFKLEFLRVVCNHEHFVPLNLPIVYIHIYLKCFTFLSDLQLDYSLSEDFCQNHFLVGLLLREVGGALQEGREVRQQSIHVLKSLMIKHTFDERYQAKQARLATLYLPLFGILQENVHRLNIKETSLLPNNSQNERDDSVPGNVSMAVPSRPGGSLDNGLHKEVFGVISGMASSGTRTNSSLTLTHHAESRGSLISTDSGNSLLDKSSDRTNSPEKVLSGNVFCLVLRLGSNGIVLVSLSLSLLSLFLPLSAAPSLTKTVVGTFSVFLMGFHVSGSCVLNGWSVLARSPLLVPDMFMSMSSNTVEPGSVLTCLQDLGHNALMKKVFQVYLCFLRIPQSEYALKQVFTSLHTFIYKFPFTFFDARADICASLCYEILKSCNSKLSSIRSDAAHLLYFLMKSNYDYTGCTSFVRTHLQVVIAVSQLIADVIVIGGTRFQQSLAIINNCANSDKNVKHTAFPGDVKDLTKRIRTVLMATEQMKEHKDDPEMLVDLQYSLAKSYASTPELRKTWLDSMARIHSKNSDLSEVAMCYVHVTALVAEYLRRKGQCSHSQRRLHLFWEDFAWKPKKLSNGFRFSMFSQGCSAFRVITPNIEEEAAMMEDVGMQDVHFNEEVLIELLQECADRLWKAERYELIADIYRLIIPIYEQRRDFEKLSHLYDTLHRAYTKVIEVMHSGKRLLGTFFRVAFFGQGFFEDEDGKEYIYKEPKFTPLSEISQRLLKLYSDKFGQENVKLIQDSNRVDPTDLDSKLAYIQVTHVTPYLEDKELEDRKTDFEKSHNIRRFVFETPFTMSGKKQGGVEEQCKRRTILTTTHCFPYVKKRIAIMYQHHTDLSPIEVAIDEMTRKEAELQELCSASDVDMIRLQLKLQGSISVQVNAGPLAYARAFLEDSSAKKYPDNKVKQLKEVFRQFVDTCGQALGVNEQLIKEDQQEYHDEMKASYRDLARELSEIMHEQLTFIVRYVWFYLLCVLSTPCSKRVRSFRYVSLLV
uniref:Dedicator of cytokinesis 9b n=1 Tax=Esox lucius TaxID=8010 RepID=A0A6Q2YUV2_ESOLU